MIFFLMNTRMCRNLFRKKIRDTIRKQINKEKSENYKITILVIMVITSLLFSGPSGTRFNYVSWQSYYNSAFTGVLTYFYFVNFSSFIKVNRSTINYFALLVKFPRFMKFSHCKNSSSLFWGNYFFFFFSTVNYY